MANKKQKSRKQGLFSKALNAALVILGLSRPITILMGPGEIQNKVTRIVNEATFNMAGGGEFDFSIGMRVYGPAAAAIGLGTLKKFLMKRFPVR